MPDPTTSDDSPAPERQPGQPRPVKAVFEDGVIRPLEPLDLPPGTPLDLHIALRVTAVAPAERPIDQNDANAGQSNGTERPAQPVAPPSAPSSTPPARPAFRMPQLGAIVAAARSAPQRLAAIGAAAALTLLLLQALASNPPLASYNWTLAPWLAACALFLAACAPAGFRPSWRGWRAAIGARPALALAVGGVVLIALALRVWRLGDIPPTLGGDEGSQGLEAIKILRGEIRHPFTTGWLGVPTMSFYFNAPTIALLGNTVAALRLPWALLGTATVLVVYWLASRLQGPVVGLTTAALLATYHYHIHFSRLGSNQVADAFFVALALLLLYRGYDRRRPLDWALCGVVIGASQYFYAGARFTAVVVAATIAMLWLRDGARFWREQRWGPLALLGAVLVSGAPMIQFAIRFPNDYNARVNEVGILQNGWLQLAEQVRQQGPLAILFDQFKHAALAFNVYPDRTVWYGSPRPLFDFTAGALFLLGLGYGTARLLDRRLFPMVAWWWGAMILGGMLTVDPPSSQRLITLAAPAVFFVALALERAGRLLIQPGESRRATPLLLAFLAVTVLSLSWSSVRWYFVEFTPLRVYGNMNAVVATDLAKYAHATLGPDTRIYFFGAPRMTADFGSILYLAPEVEHVDFIDPLTAAPQPGIVKDDKDAAFVFLPERRGELDVILREFPGGELSEAPSPLGGDPLYVVYRVPRARLAR